MKNNPALTIFEYAALLSRGSVIHFASASIRVERVPAFGGNGETERQRGSTDDTI